MRSKADETLVIVELKLIFVLIEFPYFQWKLFGLFEAQFNCFLTLSYIKSKHFLNCFIDYKRV